MKLNNDHMNYLPSRCFKHNLKIMKISLIFKIIQILTKTKTIYILQILILITIKLINIQKMNKQIKKTFLNFFKLHKNSQIQVLKSKQINKSSLIKLT